MIAISHRPSGRTWNTVSFASTLYLCPILDLLLAEVPEQLQAEIRLGLQEALVNAAKSFCVFVNSSAFVSPIVVYRKITINVSGDPKRFYFLLLNVKFRDENSSAILLSHRCPGVLSPFTAFSFRHHPQDRKSL